MVGAMMTVERTLQTVLTFFADFNVAGLKLPDGWFGRPYDNLHQLTTAVLAIGLPVSMCSSRAVRTAGRIEISVT